MNWIVLKYGGSSITKKGFNSIIKRVNELKGEYKIVIVLSAIKDVTNLLINKRNKLLEFGIEEDINTRIVSKNLELSEKGSR